MPPSKISPLLLEKYLRNECTDEEKEQVEAWYASLPGKPDYLDTLSEPNQQQLQDETFVTIQEQIQPVEPSLGRNFRWGWLAGLAASVALVIGLYGAYRYLLQPNEVASARVTVTSQKVKAEPVQQIQFINREPRPVKHRLPDNSLVWMHTGAAITYPKKFDSDRRLVTFSGEGFFDVQKDPARPFRIQSGEMQIKVLGTSFNVKAPTTQKVFQISVVTGRVQVSALDRQQKEQQVILKPQQQAIFETESRRLVSSTIPVLAKKQIYEPVTIAFDNTPLEQVIRRLEKRFAIQIRLSNPKAASCLFNADFERQPLPLILEMLCTALDATYTMTGNVIVLNSLPCDE